MSKTKIGRPTKYREEFCALVVECGKEGKGKAEIASELGVSRNTMHEWGKEYESFQDALKRAYEEALAWWERKGRDATFGGVKGFNATSYIFQMKNRFTAEWREKQEVETTNKTELVISDESQDKILDAVHHVQGMTPPESMKDED